MVETVRTSCIRCRPRPGTRRQHTTSALATSSAATRSMISGSSVSTRIALASQSVHGGGQPWELQGKANLILVLEAHATAHSAAPGARLQDGLERPSHHDVDGRPRTIFGPERLSPTGDIRDFKSGLWSAVAIREDCRRTLICMSTAIKIAGRHTSCTLARPSQSRCRQRRGVATPTRVRWSDASPLLQLTEAIAVALRGDRAIAQLDVVAQRCQ